MIIKWLLEKSGKWESELSTMEAGREVLGESSMKNDDLWACKS